MRVLENGVDLGRFLAQRLTRSVPPDSPCVGTVANLRPVKGVDVLVAAAALVTERYPRTIFRVAGEGGQRGDLETTIEHQGLSGRFLLPGGAEDVPSFLAGLDVAVLPSRSEGMSNALLEYMAAGRADRSDRRRRQYGIGRARRSRAARAAERSGGDGSCHRPTAGRPFSCLSPCRRGGVTSDRSLRGARRWCDDSRNSTGV